MKPGPALVLAFVLTSLQTAPAAEPAVLPGTQPLAPQPDFSAAMVAGIDRMALALIERSKASRRPTREKFAAAIGVVDRRLPVTALEFVGDTAAPALLAETEQCRVFRVRWPVFDGVHGEGLYVQPKERPHARLVLLPDADRPPEELVDAGLLTAGCEVVIPALVSRGTEFSRSDRLGIRTNAPHREWIHRQCYELGRHLVGYEVQKALAVVDWFASWPDDVPVLVAGEGEGGLLAACAAAIDDRIDGVFSAGWFGPLEGVWQEPLDRNVFGLLRDFGGAEIAGLIAPRPLVLQHAAYPEHEVSRAAPEGVRAVAAPGRLTAPDRAAFDAEVARTRAIAPDSRILAIGGEVGLDAVVRHLLPASAAGRVLAARAVGGPAPRLAVDPGRQERLVRELSRFSQRLLVACDAERADGFWATLPLAPRAAFESHTARHRERLWNDVIGRLPDPSAPMNPRSRLVRETEKVAIYEVTLDVWDGVFAWGWLCLPKDLGPGERRPVVVCQHGLEGLPQDTVATDPTGDAWRHYKAFALRLAERGFVTFAPHNPYRGGDAFRTLQRKLNPLGLSLFSVIIGQHQRILEWLGAQAFVDADRIAFYGLSYGGKSAMRIPAVLTGYALSICSGDFNEWVRYCVSTDLPIPGYMHAGEYEIWEWNLGRTFNYGEMAALVAPRPFMVERGHDDGCGTDEMVNAEYAKVRRLYDKLGLGDRTTIEHFDGPHTIHAVGTFRFLEEQLGATGTDRGPGDR
jgi:cephalosporin-C deacetylase-like acetyl esterase